MKKNSARTRRQKLGASKWLRQRRGTLYYPTGMGKTYTTLHLILKALLELGQLEQAHVVVPTDELRKQWIGSLPEELKYIVYVDTVQAYQYNKRCLQTDVLVLDEMHEYYSEDRIGLFTGKYFKYRDILGLTATPFDRSQRHIYPLMNFCPIIDTVTLEEARLNGWVSDYNEFNLKLTLNKNEQEKYDEASEDINANLAKFNHDFQFMIKCLSGGKGNDGKQYNGFQWACKHSNMQGYTKYVRDVLNGVLKVAPAKRALCERIHEIWHPKKVMGYARLCMSAIRVRKNILYESDTKVDAVVELVKQFYGKKIIVFSQSTTFANKCGAALRDRFGDGYVEVYHSSLPSRPLKDDKTGEWIVYKSGKKKGQPKIFGKTTLKKRAIDNIKSGKCRVIVSAAALDKGFDVEDMEVAITASTSMNPTQYTQRRGRAIRVNPKAVDSVALIVNLYFHRTKDYDWLLKAQSGRNSPAEWITSIKEIIEPNKDDIVL